MSPNDALHLSFGLTNEGGSGCDGESVVGELAHAGGAPQGELKTDNSRTITKSAVIFKHIQGPLESPIN